jgi:hypothetical protein
MLWNWRRKKRFFTGFGRGLLGVSSLFLAGRYLLTAEYWRGVWDDNPEEKK